MTYSPDVSNISTSISSFVDIVDNFCTEFSVTWNVMCEIRLCGLCTWVYRYICKSPKQTHRVFFKWSHLILNIYLCIGRYCLMDTINCSLVRSIGCGPFRLVCKYDSFPDDISSCSFSSLSLMIYFAMWFFGLEIGTTPMWQLLYVGVNTGVNCRFLVASVITLSSVCQLVTQTYLGNSYWWCC